MNYSFIIPVYNRPDDVEELLESILKQSFRNDFEIVIVEDGSTISCEEVVKKFKDKLLISYLLKSNSGPGDSRNFGMRYAKGDYFIILDSDCIIPTEYLEQVDIALKWQYVDCFGGPDKALNSFSDVQKAINFAMTSFITTGGIRGGSEKIDIFQPRSFNMGISKRAFESSGGFRNILAGEDLDLSIRLRNMGFKIKLIITAYVYHKRRINWFRFYIQVNKFGKARPILSSWYPQYNKITYFFPFFFILGLTLALITFFILGRTIFIGLYSLYFIAVFILSTIENKSSKIGVLSVFAVIIQFYGYGKGFLNSYLSIVLLKKNPEEVFPELFLKMKHNEN